MAFLSDISLTNIDLINDNTNLFHRNGTGTFWVDSIEGILKIRVTACGVSSIDKLRRSGACRQ